MKTQLKANIENCVTNLKLLHRFILLDECQDILSQGGRVSITPDMNTNMGG